VAVDEWGYITESSTGNAANLGSERYSGIHRFDPVRKAVSEYTRTVGNFMSQALDCIVLVPYLRTAESQTAKQNLLATASKLGINENSIRLSVINGVDACAAVEQLERSTQAVFKNEQLPGTDGDFCKQERMEFSETVTAWCMFIDGVTQKKSAGKSNKKPRPRRRKPQRATSLDDLLVPTRNRLKNSLQAIRKEGIKAQVISETVPWNGMSALWITCDTNHPITTMNATEKMWHRLVNVFEPDRDKIVRVKAIDLLWSSIVLVPLVGGKSLERHLIPHFKAVTYADTPKLENSPWRFSPEVIPDDVWQQLGLEYWQEQLSWAKFDRFTATYGVLFHHVDHMADFNRLPDDLDELGESLLQSYLDLETTRSQPLLQEAFDTYAELIGAFPEISAELPEVRPNIYACSLAIVGVIDAMLPTPDFKEYANLSIKEIVDWRDRLLDGMQQLGAARYLWMADSLGFGPFDDGT